MAEQVSELQRPSMFIMHGQLDIQTDRQKFTVADGEGKLCSTSSTNLCILLGL